MERNRWWLVIAVGVAVFMATLDMSIVAVALPVIEREFHTPTSTTQWVVLGYLLPLIALALPSGRWLDRVGRRSALTFSVTGFAVASIAAGLAPGIETLIGARIAQGAFGAVLFALTPVLATVTVRPEMRGRAMGVVSTLGPLGAVTGPALGGLLIDTLGWPWIFYLNVPVSLVVIAIGLAQLPAGGALRLPDRSLGAEAVLLGGAAVALLLGLSLSASDGPGWLVVAVVALPLLLGWRRMGTSLVVRELVRAPGIAGPHLALLATSASAGVVGFLAPFYLLRVLGVAASAAGLILLAFPLGMAVFGLVAGAVADRWGSRQTAVAGTVVVVAGLLLLVPLGGQWSAIDVAWRLAVLGIGLGLFNTPNMTMAMSSAPAVLLGTAGASISLARQLVAVEAAASHP